MLCRDANDAARGRDGYDFYGNRLRVEMSRGARDSRPPPAPPTFRGRGTGFRVLVKGLPISASWQDLKASTSCKALFVAGNVDWQDCPPCTCVHCQVHSLIATGLLLGYVVHCSTSTKLQLRSTIIACMSVIQDRSGEPCWSTVLRLEAPAPHWDIVDICIVDD